MSFFGFDVKLTDKVEWMFNLNHLLLILGVAAFVIGMLFAFCAKSEKGKRITMLSFGLFVLALEIGRIVWKAASHFHNNQTMAGFDWWWSISFQLCGIMAWVVAGTLIAAFFVKKENKYLQFFMNTVLGVALVAAVLTFLYPDLIDEYMPLWHFRNLQTVLMHACYPLAGLYFVKAGWLRVKLKNIWQPMLGLFGACSIAMFASHFSNHNFAFQADCGLMRDIGINMAFPLHLIVLAILYFVLISIVYILVEIFRKDKTKNVSEYTYPKITILFFVLAGVVGFGLFLLFSYLQGKPSADTKGNWLALIDFIPFIVSVVFVWLGFRFREKIEN